jgi:dCMP deaminase
MNWDDYFLGVCESVSRKSSCMSRQIGAILVKDNSVVATGYNGPPRGVPHCQGDQCPRKAKGYASGTHIDECPAQHAEENAVSNAARLGVTVFGTTLYLNTVIPCKACYGTLINAGIREIVCIEAKVYDSHTQYLIDNSNIYIRQFCP